MNTTANQNGLDMRFSELKNQGSKALVGFVCGGDPDLSRSLELIEAMCASGLDVLELGIPFSDPTADGPVIQRAASRALKAGMSLTKALEFTQLLRKKTDIPIILFTYYNPIFAYGNEAFYRDALATGVDGVLVVDLPHEESDELTSCWKHDNTFALIRLIAPTTPTQRMKEIADSGSGFLYLVSKTGVTGSSGLDIPLVRNYVNEVRSIATLPLCVGFGINEPHQAMELAPFVDGIVIGSAFERTIEANLTKSDLVEKIASQVKDFKVALTM